MPVLACLRMVAVAAVPPWHPVAHPGPLPPDRVPAPPVQGEGVCVERQRGGRGVVGVGGGEVGTRRKGIVGVCSAGGTSSGGV